MKNYILTGEPHGSDFDVKNDGKITWKKGYINEHRPHDVKLKIHISYSQRRRIHRKKKLEKKRTNEKLNRYFLFSFYSKAWIEREKSWAHWKQVSIGRQSSFSHNYISNNNKIQNLTVRRKTSNPMKICDHGWQHELIILFWNWLNRSVEMKWKLTRIHETSSNNCLSHLV